MRLLAAEHVNMVLAVVGAAASAAALTAFGVVLFTEYRAWQAEHG